MKRKAASDAASTSAASAPAAKHAQMTTSSSSASTDSAAVARNGAGDSGSVSHAGELLASTPVAPLPPPAVLPGAPEIAEDELDFTEDGFLGAGKFGRVFRGTCRGATVAIKICRVTSEASQLREIHDEISILRNVYHPNVVLFLGCVTKPDKIMIVTEYITRGNLEQVLHPEESASTAPTTTATATATTTTSLALSSSATGAGAVLSWERRMGFASDIARGMSWLHGISNIVHRDLKPANVLVDDAWRCRITDFGFAETRQRVHAREEEPKGSVVWMAPELLLGKPFNDTVDVYSFGIILCEIATLRVPYNTKFASLRPFIEAVVRAHERPSLDGVDGGLAALIRRCWSASPAERPSFRAIVPALDELFVSNVVGAVAAADAADGDVVSRAAQEFWLSVPALPNQCCRERCDLEAFMLALKQRARFERDEFSETWSALAAKVRSLFDCSHAEDAHGGTHSTTTTTMTSTATTVQASAAASVHDKPASPFVTIYRYKLLIRTFGPFFACSCLDETIDAAAEAVKRRKTTEKESGGGGDGGGGGGGDDDDDSDHDGCQAFVTLNYMASVASHPWWHNDIDRRTAERRLAHRRERTFLVRLSQSNVVDSPLTLSVVKQGVPVHKRIQLVSAAASGGDIRSRRWAVRRAGGDLLLDSFATIVELIEDPRLNLLYPCERSEIEVPYEI